MTNNRKKFVGLLSIALLLVAGIAGTFAFLTDRTDVKENTFTIGKVDINLAEPKWDAEGANHKIIPGAVLAKDPTITVTKDSEEAFVFAEVDFAGGLEEFVAFYTFDYSDDWTLLTDTAQKKVYVYKDKVGTSNVDQVLAPVFTTITFSTDLTAANLEQLKAAKINITGHAIQASGLADATAAWAELSK